MAEEPPKAEPKPKPEPETKEEPPKAEPEPHKEAVVQSEATEDHVWPMSLFVNRLYANSFACVKCKAIPKLCVTDDDGQILCKKCAENTGRTIINKAVQNLVNRLKIKCPHYKQSDNEEAEGVNLMATQCEWSGNIEAHDAHRKECQFVIVNCGQCKTFQCQRQFMAQHIAQCPELKIKCPLSCGVCVLRKNKETHLSNECMLQILDCSNDDCKEQLKRKDFENHVNNECDARIVECEYKTFGCNVPNIKAKQLDKHMEDYKFEHLSHKFDFVSNQLTKQSVVIVRQQQTIDDMKSEMEEKENGIQKLNKYMAALLPLCGLVHNYDVRILVNTGWKCVYNKPYSHRTTTNELKAVCGPNMDIFVGGYHTDNKNNIILGAFGPSSVLHQFTGSKTEAVIPSDVTYKTVYKVYWYHIKGKSFGFSSLSKVNINDPDRENTNGNDRLSWRLNSWPGWRLGNMVDLNDNNHYKMIYVKAK